MLYRFQGGNDGAVPEAPLVADAAGNLYGTTSAGGGSAACVGGCGTVFMLQRPSTSGGAWTERVLYRFQGVPSGNGPGDAAAPNGLVFDQAGNLFGMTYGGGYCVTTEAGENCYGAVYELAAPASSGGRWTEHILYRFHGPSGGPAGPIFDRAGNLYGVAIWGQFGYGMVFRLAPPSAPDGAWSESPVHSFQGSDGAFPRPGLAFDQAGRLYGATLGSPAFNDGTVYQLTPPAQASATWTVSRLYAFPFTNNASAGSEPNGGLIVSPTGSVYGTTSGGGQHGFGAVFALTPSTAGNAWTETVLHSFAAGSDGAVPSAGLTVGLQGTLYGTTNSGGSTGSGQCLLFGSATTCGVVFQVTP